MSKIVFCWELGDDYGHLGKFDPVISVLVSRGHEIYLLAKDLSKVNYFSWPQAVKVLPAPVFSSHRVKPEATHCFADILLTRGYDKPEVLETMVLGWRNLFDLINPDAVVVDHSPTALLALRDRNTPRLITSYSFVTPPPGSAPANFRPWEQADTDSINRSESRAVNVINEVAAILALRPVNCTSDLYEVDKTILYGFSELDFYRGLRGSVRYSAAMTSKGKFQTPVWNVPATTKIFAYLKFGNRQSESILSILSKLKANVVCFYSGARPEDCAKYQSAYMVVDNNLFDIAAVYAQANSIVCHAGGGMVYSALKHGCPMILLPLQLEQYNTAHILESMRIGINLPRHLSLQDVEEKVVKFFSDPCYVENARRFAYSAKESINFISEDDIANLLEELIGQTKPAGYSETR